MTEPTEPQQLQEERPEAMDNDTNPTAKLEIQDEVEAFDLNSIRIDPGSMGGEVAEKLLTTVPVTKPSKHAFIRVRSDPEFRVDTAVFQFDQDQEFYLVPPSAQGYFPSEVQFITLFTAITRAGDLFLWPVRFPDDSRRGGGREWHRTARIAAEQAQSHWIRIQGAIFRGAKGRRGLGERHYSTAGDSTALRYGCSARMGAHP